MSRHFNPHPRTEGDFTSMPGTLIGKPFQSTPSHWGWPKRPEFFEHGGAISIHTLALRVTTWKWPTIWYVLHFNPHPRTEGDRKDTPKLLAEKIFQSTPSHWGWQLHLVSLTPKHSTYRILYNFIQLICWKSPSILTAYYLFECESSWYISDAYDSHSLFLLPESHYRINGPSMSYRLLTPMDSTVFL